MSTKLVKVVVLGDISRSPRMRNHAECLKDNGYSVELIGYGDALETTENISFNILTPCPVLPFKLLNYIWKTLWTTLNLFYILFSSIKAEAVLVQNPPAIPSLFVCWFYCRIIGAKLVVDWHNYAYTIMALSVGHNSPLVWLTKKIEFVIGRRADFNFCVSKAMQKDLNDNWCVKASVLYDESILKKGQVSVIKKHELMTRLARTQKNFGFILDHGDSTIFTRVSTEGVSLRENRPAFIISSTSWTEDEDFSILIDSLQDYEDHCQNGNNRKLPQLVVAITGKGPLRDYYSADINSRKWQHIKVIYPWLDARDYLTFVGCADFGISLHTSSSGLDLPMKVVDMLGSCVPVLAYKYQTLNELVLEGTNGFMFSNQEELSSLLQKYLDAFPRNIEKNEAVRKICDYLSNRKVSWQDNWNNVAAPVFK